MNNELRQVINDFEQIFQYAVNNNGDVTKCETIDGVCFYHPDNGIDHFTLQICYPNNYTSNTFYDVFTSVDLNSSRYALILTDNDNFICKEYHLDQYDNLTENTISLDEYKRHLESWKNTVKLFIKYKDTLTD